KRHPDPSLQGIEFPATKGRVASESLIWCSIITKKENECLFSEIVGAECLHHFANTVIHRRDHCGVGSSVWIADVCNTVEITLRSLIGAVRSVVRQIEEKWLCRMSINKRHRLAGKPIRQVLGFGNRGVVSEKGSIEVWRLRFQKTIEFVEPSLKWPKSEVRPEMPFTDRTTHIANWLEYLGQQ